MTILSSARTSVRFRRDDNDLSAPSPVVLGTPPATGRAPAGPARVRRFNGVAIATHWAHGALFLLLLATGLALFHPQWRNWDIAGIKVVKETHLTLALLYVLLPLTVAAWDGWRSLRAGAQAMLRWERRDWAWLAALAARLVGRRPPLPPQGRFNAGQKLNTAFIMAVGTGLVITGGLIWPDGLLGPGGRALVFGLHDLLMLLSLPALAVHLLLATVYPPARPALRGMLDGWVPADWHAAHHPLDTGPPGAAPAGPAAPRRGWG
jgi:formate dehydrogenase subunit gamma